MFMINMRHCHSLVLRVIHILSTVLHKEWHFFTTVNDDEDPPILSPDLRKSQKCSCRY